MSRMTAEDLYNIFLNTKLKDPNHNFCSTDLLGLGNVDDLMDELEFEGKIRRKSDIIESFDVIG